MKFREFTIKERLSFDRLPHTNGLTTKRREFEPQTGQGSRFEANEGKGKRREVLAAGKPLAK